MNQKQVIDETVVLLRESMNKLNSIMINRSSDYSEEYYERIVKQRNKIVKIINKLLYLD